MQYPEHELKGFGRGCANCTESRSSCAANPGIPVVYCQLTEDGGSQLVEARICRAGGAKGGSVNEPRSRRLPHFPWLAPLHHALADGSGSFSSEIAIRLPEQIVPGLEARHGATNQLLFDLAFGRRICRGDGHTQLRLCNWVELKNRPLYRRPHVLAVGRFGLPSQDDSQRSSDDQHYQQRDCSLPFHALPHHTLERRESCIPTVEVCNRRWVQRLSVADASDFSCGSKRSLAAAVRHQRNC